MDVRTEISGHVARITLNRPEQRNAYTPEMGRLLGEAYLDCDADDSVRAIVLTGAGPAFCVGADVEATNPFDSPAGAGFSASPVRPAAFELRKPVIAALNGHAIGIGLTLALQADLRVVARDAKYAVPQARRGVVGDCMSHWTLQRLAGLGTAADLLLTGRTVSGAEAVQLRIANESAPSDQVLARATAIAADIAENVAPMSAALSKQLLWQTAAQGYGPRQVAELETRVHERLMGSADSREGVLAYRERRAPRWSASVSRDWLEIPEPDSGR